MTMAVDDLAPAADRADFASLARLCGLDPARALVLPIQFTFAIETQFPARYGFRGRITAGLDEDNLVPVSLASTQDCDNGDTPGVSDLYNVYFRTIQPGQEVVTQRWAVISAISPSNPTGELGWGVQAEAWFNNLETPLVDFEGPGVCEQDTSDVDVVLSGDCPP